MITSIYQRLSKPFVFWLFYVSLHAMNTKQNNLFVDGKKVSDSFQLSGKNTEYTAAKFALSPNAEGKLNIKFQSATSYPSNNDLAVYLYAGEETWKKVKNVPTCEDKMKLANSRHGFKFYPEHIGSNQENRDYRKIDLNSVRFTKEIDWKAKVDLTVGGGKGIDNGLPHYWYITIADCSLERYYRDNQIPNIHYDLEILDEAPSKGQYSHLSHDEQGLSFLHLCNVILFGGVIGWMTYHILSRLQKGQECHVSILLITGACIMHALSSFFEMSHLLVYAKNGVGSYSADALSAHLEASADSLLCWILMAIATGWTLPPNLSSPLSGGESSAQQPMKGKKYHNNIASLQYYVRHAFTYSFETKTSVFINPGFQMFAVLDGIHAILCQWGRTYNDDFDSYHDLEHLPGRILLIFRFVLAILFLMATATLKAKCHSQSLSKFLHSFSLIGASWYISLPSLALVVSSRLVNLPAHRRHPIMTMLSMVLQFFSIVSLAWLFTGGQKSSAYHKISNVDPNNRISSGLGSHMDTEGFSVFSIGKTKIRLD